MSHQERFMSLIEIATSTDWKKNSPIQSNTTRAISIASSQVYGSAKCIDAQLHSVVGPIPGYSAFKVHASGWYWQDKCTVFANKDSLAFRMTCCHHISSLYNTENCPLTDGEER